MSTYSLTPTQTDATAAFSTTTPSPGLVPTATDTAVLSTAITSPGLVSQTTDTAVLSTAITSPGLVPTAADPAVLTPNPPAPSLVGVETTTALLETFPPEGNVEDFSDYVFEQDRPLTVTTSNAGGYVYISGKLVLDDS